MSDRGFDGIGFLTADIQPERTVGTDAVPGSIPESASFLDLEPTLEAHVDDVWLTDTPGI